MSQGDDERVVLFVRLRGGITLDGALRERIKKQIRAETTPRGRTRLTRIDPLFADSFSWLQSQT